MKKLLACILILAIAVSAVPIVFADEEAESVSELASGKYDILYQLEILNRDYAKNGYLTRAEAAATVLKLGGYTLLSGGDALPYVDVPDDHPYWTEISNARLYGIMNGRQANVFSPNEPITFGELKTIILRATEFEKLADLKWIYQKAESLLNRGNVYAIGSEDTVSLPAAEALLFAVLDFPCIETEPNNRAVDTGKTLLNKVFDVYRMRGTLNAVYGAGLGGRSAAEGELIITGKNGTDYRYFSGDAEYLDYLGCSVEYYYDADPDRMTVLYMTLSGTREPLRLMFDEITDAAKDLSSLTYYKGNKNGTVRISADADFIYNGVNCYDITAQDLMPDNGMLTLADSDGNGVYDMVNIVHYRYIMVEKVNLDNSTILDAFTWQNQSLAEDGDAEKVEILKNGKSIKLAFLEQGNLLAIAASRDGKRIKAHVSEARLFGTLEEISRADRRITIAGETVNCIRGLDLDTVDLMQTVTVGIDMYGYAVGIISDYTEEKINYGYLYAMSDNQSEFNPLRWAKIFTTAGKPEKYEIPEKVCVNDGMTGFAVLDTALRDSTTGKLSPQLIAYSLNRDGQISRIYTAGEEQPTPDARLNKPLVLNKSFNGDAMAVYNNFGMTLDFEYNMLGSGKIIDVPLDGDGEVLERKLRVTTVSQKLISASTRPKGLYLYNADVAGVSGLAVYIHSAATKTLSIDSHKSQAFLITDIVSVWDDKEQESVTKLRGYYNGSVVEYGIDDTVDITSLRSGDVVIVWMSDDTISAYRRVFGLDIATLDGLGSQDSMALFANDSYTEEKPATSIEEIRYGLSSSTKPSGSRWYVLYGTPELVYKANKYKFPIVKMLPSGSSKYSFLSMDANTRIYAYSIKRGTVEVITTDSVDFSYGKALICTRYGNVRDVVIYEE